MKKIILPTALLLLLFVSAYSQTPFVDDVRQFIDYDAPVIAFSNALLIDGKGGAPRTGQTIVIHSGKIEAIGESSTKIPAGATVIDLKGSTASRIRHAS